MKSRGKRCSIHIASRNPTPQRTLHLLRGAGTSREAESEENEFKMTAEMEAFWAQREAHVKAGGMGK